MKVTVIHMGQRRECAADAWEQTADAMVRELGAWVPGESRVEKERSTFAAQVTDDAAAARINASQDALRNAGVNVDASRQLFDTGTRMADSGYDKQAERAAEHAAKSPLREASRALVDAIQAERRRDHIVTAGELGKALAINGALTFDGMKLREQAVRGLLGRLKSPALGYVLGLRERIGAQDATPEHKASDKAELLEVLRHEAARYENVKLRLRTRAGLGDVFAIMSPEYTPADAPEVLPEVIDALPGDAKGSFAYDPVTTTWELRASVYTPVPTDEQAVGEPFEGYAAFSGRDNGTRRLTGGGGILLIACLNATTYEAASSNVSRVHRGRVMLDLGAMASGAVAAISALCQAWGIARADVVEAPKLVPITEAIPGFYRCMLTSRKGELVGVLPGRTAAHVEALAMTFDGQRRNVKEVTRADLAQGFTRYIQEQQSAVRRDAERAIGRWMVNKEPVNYVAA
jgi:hypothetical protein